MQIPPLATEVKYKSYKLYIQHGSIYSNSTIPYPFIQEYLARCIYNYGKIIVMYVILFFVTSHLTECLVAIHRRRLVYVNIDKCQRCHLLLYVLLLQMKISNLAEMFSTVATDKTKKLTLAISNKLANPREIAQKMFAKGWTVLPAKLLCYPFLSLTALTIYS